MELVGSTSRPLPCPPTHRNRAFCLHLFLCRPRSSSEGVHGPQILKGCIEKGRACSTQDEKRNVKDRPLRQEGQKPETGHCDRPLRSPQSRQESPRQKGEE